jgi:hypothetical protein
MSLVRFEPKILLKKVGNLNRKTIMFGELLFNILLLTFFRKITKHILLPCISRGYEYVVYVLLERQAMFLFFNYLLCAKIYVCL